MKLYLEIQFQNNERKEVRIGDEKQGKVVGLPCWELCKDEP
jgi:hypothetical protein